MVRRVCGRTLIDPHDAEDAFQATLLILVRQARSIRVDKSIGLLLYGVGKRVAARARTNVRRRRRREQSGLVRLEAQAAEPDATSRKLLVQAQKDESESLLEFQISRDRLQAMGVNDEAIASHEKEVNGNEAGRLTLVAPMDGKIFQVAAKIANLYDSGSMLMLMIPRPPD